MPRCAGRTGVGGSFLSPPVSFLFLPSSQNSIEIVRKNFSPFSYHPFPLFLPHQQNSSSIPSNNFIIFRNETFVFASYTQHLTFQNRYKRSKSKTGSDRERERKVYRRKRISTLSRSRSSDLGIIDINKMYEDAWNLRQHTLMSTVERFIVSSMPR